MKYVRTKDGIYELTIWQCDLSGEMLLVKANNKFGNDRVFTKDIIKYADTIPELCDRVIIKDFNITEPRIYSIKKYNWIKVANTLFNERKVEWVKFAIWTDNGLIYVAQMNEKGDLNCYE